uniref:Uncharacterized protein n=1 Tax=Glossina palpalis gambiensis TaxID=67801 RepID=A0A1B0B0B2_9MUSC
MDIGQFVNSWSFSLGLTSTIVPSHHGFYRRSTTEDSIKDFSDTVLKSPRLFASMHMLKQVPIEVVSRGHRVQSSIPKYNGKSYYLIT